MAPKVLLVSPYECENAGLHRMLNAALELQCELCGHLDLHSFREVNPSALPPRLLLLIDFIGFDDRKLCRMLWDYHKRRLGTQGLSAVYNLPRKAGFEKKALQIGASGVFYEDYGPDLFKKGVSCLLEGDIWFPRKVLYEEARSYPSRNRQEPSCNNGPNSLTPRQKEILVMIANGLTNAEIAEKLYISANTVKTHVYNIFQKINVPNRIQALLWTARHF